jgi:hypothetical protein
VANSTETRRKASDSLVVRCIWLKHLRQGV